MSDSEKRKYSYLDNCIKLKEKGLHKAAVRFAQIDTFHVCMEMLLTVYIIEMVVLLTNICLKKPSSPIKISPFVVFLPFMIATVVTLVFTIWALWYFRKKAYAYLKDYFTDDASTCTASKKENNTYDSFIKKHKKNTRWVHIGCIALYLIISFVIAKTLDFSTDLFNQNFVWYVTIIASVLGALWNWAGYCRHQRILWCRFFPTMRNCKNAEYDEIREKDVKYNCTYHRRSILSIIVSMAFLLFLFAIVVVNFHPEDGSISIIGLLDKGYGTLLVPFFTLVIAYVKLCYSISYDHNDNAIICPSLEGALSEHPRIITIEQGEASFEQSKEQKLELMIQKLGAIEKQIVAIEQLLKPDKPDECD